MSAEILAPAGSRDSLIAAVRCGANAVYLGGKVMNARRNAGNFSHEELAGAVDYCHKRGVKVYVTLNTLVFDSEIDLAAQEIEFCARCGVDALIIQDLGILQLAKRICPSMPLHASTQMSVQSKYGVAFLREQGFARAVLPRELSEKEIAAISAFTDIELEHFVHGAQCMCLSGQCLMSSVIGGRSGNRGLCAQPCRLPFGVNGGKGNNLSLKDMSLIGRAARLENAGVCSFKIEGRMKRPEYVAAAVTACRNALDGRDDPEITGSLSAVFSRQGFTSGYFDGKTGREMFGIRTKDDVEATPAVLGKLAKLYEKENPLIPLEMSFYIGTDRAELTVSASGHSASARTALVSPAVNREITADEVRARLSKCGGTQFYVSGIEGTVESGLYVSASELNSLRRNALAALEESFAAGFVKNVKDFTFTKENYTPAPAVLHLRFFTPEQIPADVSRAARVIIPLETGADTVKSIINQGVQVAAEVPVNVFSNADMYLEMLLKQKQNGVSLAWCANIDGIAIAKKAGMDFACGFGMNIANTLALGQAERFGAKDALLSCEMSAGAIRSLGSGIGRGVLLYGRLPLMVTRNCPAGNCLTCAECDKKSFLQDRTGARFPVICKNGCSFVLNSVALCNFDKKDAFSADSHLLYFTDETRERCEEIIKMYYENRNPQAYTRGLYFRNVL